MWNAWPPCCRGDQGWAGNGRLSSRLLALPQNRLGLDLDLDLVADHDAARHRRVEGDPELAPVDLPAGRETGPGAAEGIRAEPVDLEREGDRAGHPADGQLTIEDEVVAILADAGGVVGHLRVGGGVEEVRRPEVVVACLIASVHGGQVDGRGGG